MCMAFMEMLYFHQGLWVVTLVLLFWISLWKSIAASLHCVFGKVNRGWIQSTVDPTTLDLYVPNSIADEPLFGETRVRCII